MGKIGTAHGTHRVVSTTRNSKQNSQFNSPHKFGHVTNASVDDSLLAPGMEKTIPSENTFHNGGARFGGLINSKNEHDEVQMHSTDTLPKLKGGARRN